MTVINGHRNGNGHSNGNGNVTLTALLRRVEIVNVTSCYCNVTSRVHDNNVISTVYYILPYKYKHIITSVFSFLLSLTENVIWVVLFFPNV